MTESNGVYIEVTPLPTSRRQISPVDRSWERLTDSLPVVRAAIDQGVELALSAASAAEPDGAWRLSEIELSFGVKVTAEAGVIVSSVGGEASLEVTIRATRRGDGS